jgi:hypothetical protein
MGLPAFLLPFSLLSVLSYFPTFSNNNMADTRNLQMGAIIMAHNLGP